MAAQEATPYPNQIVRIVVPFSAGSNTDGQARIIADKLSELWKQQVIVENRPGVAGTASVAKAAADGYTLMLTSSGHPVANVINRSAPFDPVKDFAGVTQTTSVPAALVVPLEFQAKTVSDFIALARQKPGTLNFSSAGTASTSYLAGEVFKQVAKIDIVHIPHKGAPEAMTSILRNDSQLYFASANSTTELYEAKKIGIIAVSSGKRFPPLPNVPTVKESGLADYEYDSWFGVMAPAGVPEADPQQGQPGHRARASAARRRREDEVAGAGGGDAIAGSVRRHDQVRGRPLRQDPAGRGRRRKLEA